MHTLDEGMDRIGIVLGEEQQELVSVRDQIFGIDFEIASQIRLIFPWPLEEVQEEQEENQEVI